MGRIEFAFGDGGDDFAVHDPALEMGVGVILAGAILPARRWSARAKDHAGSL